ncbi:TetR/AcrR family transcriptional regulator [Mycolicibacterium sp. GF69]|nr:TetR/AcrR family transcriptional regulator [Mycolicibacterium sp. GF69]
MEALRDKYAENTRQALIDAALRLFANRAYADLSAEELVRSAGLSRGALYHHFDGKRGLFEAVVDVLERQAAQRVQTAIVSVSDPFDRIDRGVGEFLAVCAEPDYRHIVLEQAPIALGWQRFRELDLQHLGGLLLGAVRNLLDARMIRPHPAELIAAAFYGALTELPLTVAAADDPAAAREQAASLVHDLVHGLAADRS